MGEVLATVKVMPESPEVDLEALKETITNNMPDDAELDSIVEEPVAFGLVALIVKFIIEDGEGGTESTEQAISEIPEVASIEFTGMGRLM